MNQRLKQLLVGLLVVGSAEGLYGIIQRNNFPLIGQMTEKLMLEMDRTLPFAQDWIWIYISIFPSFILAAVLLEEKAFNKTLWRVTAAQLLTFPFFIFFPADYPRPPMVDDGTLYGWGYALMHRLDGPNNTFPSLHVSMTWVIMHEFLFTAPIRTVLVISYSVLVTFSVLFTKQHFVWDAVGGFGVYLLTLCLYRYYQRHAGKLT